MHYNYNTILGFVIEILKGVAPKTWHLARLKALVLLLRGMLLLRQASLSAMGRGAAVIEANKSFIAGLQQAHRLMKNAEVDRWELAQGLYRYVTKNLKEVLMAVDWTDVGYFKVLEASILVEGRGIPLGTFGPVSLRSSDSGPRPDYSLAVHREELCGRQTAIELTMWYALCAMRLPGQLLRVVVDRGFAKFNFVGASPLYPYMHLIIRLKGSMILTWDTVQGPLREWPLYAL